jgi:hypothetical protein
MHTESGRSLFLDHVRRVHGVLSRNYGDEQRARRAAARSGHLWTGRIVLETRVTHILMLTDHPGQVHDADRAIEIELQRLKAGFAIRRPARVPLPILATKLGSPARKQPPRSPAG